MQATLFGILIIGDEILSGRRKDKHFEKVIEILQRRDLELSWARYAGDDESMLVQQFREIRKLGHV
ncbi:MAG: molybdopterin-binding protein, partial [Thioalkalispiraceae bacterium]